MSVLHFVRFEGVDAYAGTDRTACGRAITTGPDSELWATASVEGMAGAGVERCKSCWRVMLAADLVQAEPAPSFLVWVSGPEECGWVTRAMGTKTGLTPSRLAAWSFRYRQDAEEYAALIGARVADEPSPGETVATIEEVRHG